MDRRKNIFRTKRNKFNNQIIQSRTRISDTKSGDEVYQWLHLIVTEAGFQLSLRVSDDRPYISPVGTGALWENVLPAHQLGTLEDRAKSIINAFSRGEHPTWVPALVRQQFGGVMV